MSLNNAQPSGIRMRGSAVRVPAWGSIGDPSSAKACIWMRADPIPGGPLPCRAVHLQAGRDLGAGEELTLDYGTQPMRDMLRSYAFVPSTSCHEVRAAGGS